MEREKKSCISYKHGSVKFNVNPSKKKQFLNPNKQEDRNSSSQIYIKQCLRTTNNLDINLILSR